MSSDYYGSIAGEIATAKEEGLMGALSTPSGALHGYELAFMRRGHILVRDYGNRIVLMWLTVPATTEG